MYFLLPSQISMISSSVHLHFMQISTFLTLYSFNILFINSSSRSGFSTILVILIPPLSFSLKSINGGSLFNLIPKPSSSRSIIYLWRRGLVASRTMQIKLQVLATAITCLPRPLPSLAPSMIPGRSSSWIFAPL